MFPYPKTGDTTLLLEKLRYTDSYGSQRTNQPESFNRVSICAWTSGSIIVDTSIMDKNITTSTRLGLGFNDVNKVY